ncbi:MAG: hypothetical protein P1V51_22410 [Deltaproteobacteria bacterium]|nr:hypothetical protein [Deltaproteobacteria bacterium]
MRYLVFLALLPGMALAQGVIYQPQVDRSSRLVTMADRGVPQYRMTTSPPGALPPCTEANGCVMQCAVTAAGHGCREGDGTTITVENPLNNVTADCFGQPDSCLRMEHNANDDPYLSAGTADALGLPAVVTGPHTVVSVAFTDDTNGATNIRGFSYGVANTTGVENFLSATSGACAYNNSPTRDLAGISVPLQDGWNVMTCRTSSSTSRLARVNGRHGAENTSAWTVDDPTGNSFQFGSLGTSLSVHGYLHSLTLYSRALSDAEVAAIERGYYGTSAATVRDSIAACAKGSGASRTYDLLGYDWPCTDLVRGIDGYGTIQNYATESFDVPSLTVVGTPTVAALAAGPFDRALVGAGAYTVGDDDAGVAELFYLFPPSSGTIPNDATVTVSFQALAGTATPKTQIGCIGGTGTSTVEHTLTGDWATYTDTTTCAANTDTYVRYYPAGTVASATGTNSITAIQVEVGGVVHPVCPSLGAATTCAANVEAFPPPHQIPRKIEFDLTHYDVGSSETRYILDCFATQGFAFHQGGSDSVTFTTSQADGDNRISTTGPRSPTAGVADHFAVMWDPRFQQTLFANRILEDSDAASKVPSSYNDPCYLMTSNGGALLNWASVNNLVIW